MRTDDGENVFEHLAGVEDFEIAMATYRAACERWPGAAITLRQGARVIEDTGNLSIAPLIRSFNSTRKFWPNRAKAKRPLTEAAYISADRRSVKNVLPSAFGLSVTHIAQGVPSHRVAVA
jgi:hypothetical protein